MNDELIVDVIKELSCNSAAGPDGVPVALLKNASVELAKPKPLIEHSLQPLNQHGSCCSVYMERSGRCSNL